MGKRKDDPWTTDKATELRIYGASDDLVELEGILRDEVNEIDSDKGVPITIGEPRTGGIRVVAFYAAPFGGDKGKAVWGFRVEPLDEDVACPWPIRIEAHGYSAHVVVGCPQGTPVTYPGQEGGDTEDDDG